MNENNFNPESLHKPLPDASISIQPEIVVKVSEEANRDEITGAVARALTTSDVPFLKGRSSHIQASEQTIVPEQSEGPAPVVAAHLEAAATDQSLTINITTQGSEG